MIESFGVMVVLGIFGFMTNVSMPYFLVFFLLFLSVPTSFIVGGMLGSVFGYYVILLYVGGLMAVVGFIVCLYPNQAFVKPKIGGIGVVGSMGCLLLCFSKYLSPGSGSLIAMSLSLSNSNVKWGSFFSWWYGGSVFVMLAVILLYAMVVVSCFGSKGGFPLRVNC